MSKLNQDTRIRYARGLVETEAAPLMEWTHLVLQEKEAIP
jgi:hypothetical protein